MALRLSRVQFLLAPPRKEQTMKWMGLFALVLLVGCDAENYTDHVVYSEKGKKYLHAWGWRWNVPCDQAKAEWQQRLCDKEFMGRNWKLRVKTCRTSAEGGGFVYYACYSYQHRHGAPGNNYSCKEAIVEHEKDICGEEDKKEDKKKE